MAFTLSAKSSVCAAPKAARKAGRVNTVVCRAQGGMEVVSLTSWASPYPYPELALILAGTGSAFIQRPRDLLEHSPDPRSRISIALGT